MRFADFCRCRVLTARVDDGAMGWFIATVVTSVVSSWYKKDVPTANYIVEYKKAETGSRILDGKSAVELTAAKYGPEEWWLLLEPVS